MQIGVLGSGDVARTLASGFLKHGYHVTLGSRDPDKLKDWAIDNPEGRTGSFAQTAVFGEILVLAVKGTAALKALELAGRSHLESKTVIDACNPISDAPPENGVLSFFTGPNESLMERLQRDFPDVHFVKAFNSVGAL